MAWGFGDFKNNQQGATPNFVAAEIAQSQADNRNAQAKAQAKADMLNGALMGAQVYNYGMGESTPIADWWGADAALPDQIDLSSAADFGAADPSGLGIQSAEAVQPASNLMAAEGATGADAALFADAGAFNAGAETALAGEAALGAEAVAGTTAAAPAAGGFMGGMSAAMPYVGAGLIADQLLLDGAGTEAIGEGLYDLTDFLGF
tara:strand:+ start:27859 stop:28473 length:615 start_codon:yes stop_codon:yes gene_type:complete